MAAIPRSQFAGQRLAAGILIVHYKSAGMAMTATLRPRPAGAATLRTLAKEQGSSLFPS